MARGEKGARDLVARRNMMTTSGQESNLQSCSQLGIDHIFRPASTFTGELQRKLQSYRTFG